MTDSTRVTESLRGYTAVYWGLLLSAAPLAAFANVLHRHTHHRPLGAVTFVLGATAVLMAALLVARRCKEKGGGLWRACRIAALLSALLPILLLFSGR
jgi:hypothetical protein